MKSASEMRVRVVMGMLMCSFCTNLTVKVSIRACSLSYSFPHVHLKT